MKISQIDYSATHSFSPLVIDYLQQNKNLAPFYHRFPAPENFEQQIAEKQFSAKQRALLCEELEKQFALLPDVHANVRKNLDLLKQPNTFTITTGHQLSIFTGPLYFIYKIITAIKTAHQLKEQYPDYNFVPVYWMASEDHDFAEINHFTLFSKAYSWETDQKGAVGRFKTNSIFSLIESLPENFPLFEKAYTEFDTLSAATRFLAHELFGEFGLISIDADVPALKKALQPVIKNELLEQITYKLVNGTTEKLAAAGYKTQVTPREINLFYLDNGLRERLVKKEERYQVLNTDLSFTQEEILALAEAQPEKFSPNVILRPLYEEIILPNLCYIGGGAEVAYWFQLKEVFDYFKVPFPVLMLRNSGLYIAKNSANRMHKLNLQAEDLFHDLPSLKKQVTATYQDTELNLEEEKKQVESIFAQIEKLAVSIDPTLSKTVAAEAQKTHNALMVLEKKIVKANDSKYETIYNQLTSLKDKLFPNGTLQERVDNLLTYQTNNPEFIRHLYEAFEPFAGKFTILEEE
ncbi:bacillithiol biosynthesis cysteine-adding enzyme BshC [Adhaeribacter radiodurans]|uniref:Putative cysteine ligase BshC n=1 Tax=Adhaeribacter radiodurans TaxID=2745197 RepID=A0A7L7L3C5_9BACT|nr:bacillithiol biosynthesis cysteine-adding enzyme BshC [Adhaeribacter radiodurans]QMU27273.1 bacillithiol biosynthesis cysteine-adding enzyme BshC [Adhaeribacter radiodurans]